MKGSSRAKNQLDSFRTAICDRQTDRQTERRRQTQGHTLASTQPGMPGTHPQYFGWGTSTGISPPILSRTFGYIADQYWLHSVRSASSRFHSAIRRHQFASVRQADSRLTSSARNGYPGTRVPVSIPVTRVPGRYPGTRVSHNTRVIFFTKLGTLYF